MDLPEKPSTIKRRRSLQFRFCKWFIPKFFYTISFVIFGTSKIVYHNKDYFDNFVSKGQSIIFACFHQGILFLPFFLRHKRYGSRIGMVSSSPEGDYIVGAMALFGQKAARGSSTRGGKAALQVMIDMLKEGKAKGKQAHHGLMTVDGPKGPAQEVKMGVIKLAKETGLPIVPSNWYATPAWTFGNWDETMLPSPFSKIVMAYEEPIFVPEDASDEEMEELRQKANDRLQKCYQVARDKCSLSA